MYVCYILAIHLKLATHWRFVIMAAINKGVEGISQFTILLMIQLVSQICFIMSKSLFIVGLEKQSKNIW